MNDETKFTRTDFFAQYTIQPRNVKMKNVYCKITILYFFETFHREEMAEKNVARDRKICYECGSSRGSTRIESVSENVGVEIGCG